MGYGSSVLDMFDFESMDDLLYLRELIHDVSHYPDAVVATWRDVLEEAAMQKGICPECLARLECQLVTSECSEAWGVTVRQPIYEYYCPVCGWRE